MNSGHDTVSRLHTEQRNKDTMDIADVDTTQMLSMINALDHTVASAVKKAIPQISEAVDIISDRLARGGRLVYVGAGTSGRLGIMDAAECGPTYGVDNVHCIIAGGKDAVFRAQETLEDSAQCAEDDLIRFGVGNQDTIFALSASGRTPYCVHALDYAKKVGAVGISLSCNPNSVMSRHAAIGIEVDTGTEAVMGSTRMKAGTAQKMVLNMISTSTMIKLGRTHSNLMIKLNCRNSKCEDRAARIYAEAVGISDIDKAKTAIAAADGSLEIAVLMGLTKATKEQAMDAISVNNHHFPAALQCLRAHPVP